MLCLSLVSAYAQLGGMGGPNSQMSGVLTRLIGKDATFSASMEMETTATGGATPMTVPGKLTYDHSKVRFEIDISAMKGGNIPEGVVSQMKAMSMDKIVVVSRPDKKTMYMIYPGLKSYLENPLPDNLTTDLKVETTELGKETVVGHACAKQKAVVTDAQGKQHEATVWRASDLKGIPVKITQVEGNTTTTMTFKDINQAKPVASLFEVPADGTKYESPMALMQGAMQKQLGGVPGAVPVAPPPTSPSAPRRPSQ